MTRAGAPHGARAPGRVDSLRGTGPVETLRADVEALQPIWQTTHVASASRHADRALVARSPPPVRRVIFTVEGWEDYEGNRHRGPATDITDTYGVFVHVSDPDNPETHKFFWAFVGGPFGDWDEWYVYIGALMTMYGLELE